MISRNDYHINYLISYSFYFFILLFHFIVASFRGCVQIVLFEHLRCICSLRSPVISSINRASAASILYKYNHFNHYSHPLFIFTIYDIEKWVSHPLIFASPVKRHRASAASIYNTIITYVISSFRFTFYFYYYYFTSFYSSS